MASQAELATLEELVEYLDELEDLGSEIMRKDPLASVGATGMIAPLLALMVPRRFIAGRKALKGICRRVSTARTIFVYVM